MILRWHGHTSFLESLYIIPGGFGNGIALSTTFIALTAGVEQGQMAIASSGLYLSSNIGMVSGLSIAVAILQSTLRKELRIGLEGEDGREEVGIQEKVALGGADSYSIDYSESAERYRVCSFVAGQIGGYCDRGICEMLILYSW
jgi:hypothetical protein